MQRDVLSECPEAWRSFCAILNTDLSPPLSPHLSRDHSCSPVVGPREPRACSQPLAAGTWRGCTRRAQPGALPGPHAVSLVLGGACGLLRPQLTLRWPARPCASFGDSVGVAAHACVLWLPPRTPWQPRSRGRCARSCSWKSRTRQTPRTASLLSSRGSPVARGAHTSRVWASGTGRDQSR